MYKPGNDSIFAAALIIAVLLLFSPALYAQAKVGTFYNPLNLSSSPRVNALGGFSVTLSDARSGIFNPAGVGLFHLRKNLAIALPFNTSVVSDVDEDIHLEAYQFSIGGNLSDISSERRRKFNLAFGFSLARQKLVSGDIIYTDYDYPYGIDTSDITTFKFVDRMDYYSFGLAVEYFIRVGLGYTHKRPDFYIEPDSLMRGDNVDGSASDYGVIVQLPIDKLVTGYDSDTANAAFQTLSIGYILGNRGEIEIGDTTYDITETEKYGISLAAGYRHNGLTMLSGRLMFEREDRPRGNRFHIDRWAFEIGIHDIFYARGGRVTSNYSMSSTAPDGDTWGFGLTTAGLTDLLIARGSLQSDNRVMNYLLKNLELSFDYAKAPGLTGHKEIYTSFVLTL